MKQLPLISLQSIDPTRNRFRFYSLHFDRDLWGQRMLIRQYGRIGTHGHIYMEPVSSLLEARKRAGKLIEAKMKRGYLTETSTFPRLFNKTLTNHSPVTNNMQG